MPSARPGTELGVGLLSTSSAVSSTKHIPVMIMHVRKEMDMPYGVLKHYALGFLICKTRSSVKGKEQRSQKSLEPES